MQSISKFDVNVYSEELMAGVSESDYDEVMSASAVEGEEFEGYVGMVRILRTSRV